MTFKAQLKPLDRQTIVVTGATSGIGLATARRAARRGAKVFLIARGESDLKALCEELQGLGGRAAWAVADVADAEALEAAAEKCERLFGGFDTWVNNAGVAIFGSIKDTLLEDQRRVFDTNYWGVVNGSLVAAERLKRRPGGGSIINVGSVLSDAPVPVLGVYSASKHAVKGFTNAFRMELLREKAPVSVSLIKPAAIDTPYNRHARNLTGQAMQNPQPVYATHVVADTILYCASHPIREITVGAGGRIIAAFYSALPGVAEPLMAAFAPSLMRDRHSAYRPYDDGLYDPTEDGLDEEVHYPMVRQFSALAEVRKHPGVTGGVLAALALGVIGAVLLAQRTGPTRYEMIRRRIDPRGWIDTDALKDRFDDFAETVRHGAEDLSDRAGEIGGKTGKRAQGLFEELSDRAGEFGGKAGKRAHGLFDDARDYSRDRLSRGGREARRYARDAGGYARDHAREGGAILAIATIAAAIGAAVLESQQPNSKVRRITRL